MAADNPEQPGSITARFHDAAKGRPLVEEKTMSVYTDAQGRERKRRALVPTQDAHQVASFVFSELTKRLAHKLERRDASQLGKLSEWELLGQVINAYERALATGTNPARLSPDGDSSKSAADIGPVGLPKSREEALRWMVTRANLRIRDRISKSINKKVNDGTEAILGDVGFDYLASYEADPAERAQVQEEFDQLMKRLYQSWHALHDSSSRTTSLWSQISPRDFFGLYITDGESSRRMSERLKREFGIALSPKSIERKLKEFLGEHYASVRDVRVELPIDCHLYLDSDG